LSGQAIDAIAIRAAKPGDERLILSLIRELAEYERLLDAVEATEEKVAATLFGAAPRVFCDLAEVQGEPAGFALWFYNYSTFLAKSGIYLEDLFVRPAFRGRGIGKALLATLARRALHESCGRFEWAVLDWNEPSISFYKALGARPLSDWTVFRLDGEALTKLAQQ
jgi:GNAT superfamily N-acetyltransferase